MVATSTKKDAGQGSRVYLPVLVEDAVVFFGDPHAAISDGIITGTGIECSMSVRARITLLKHRVLERPIIAQGGAVHFVGVGPSVEEATEDAAGRAVDFAVTRTGLGREEAYMLLSIIGELRVGTSPRPVMATRLIVPEEPLRAAGWNGELPWRFPSLLLGNGRAHINGHGSSSASRNSWPTRRSSLNST